ncbi:MAG: hypothetical protein DRN27_09865 [Thermoplasmata archaeon]|nr:MAG: hypothetical protein DRN27_09865 [Thermoplasmata archaeon]
MPYIKKDIRQSLDHHLELISIGIMSPGELNYCITCLIQRYVKDNGKSYTTMNECIGVLDSAKMEFYRRVVAPYEHQKVEENGDIDILK